MILTQLHKTSAKQIALVSVLFCTPHHPGCQAQSGLPFNVPDPTQQWGAWKCGYTIMGRHWAPKLKQETNTKITSRIGAEHLPSCRREGQNWTFPSLSCDVLLSEVGHPPSSLSRACCWALHTRGNNEVFQPWSILQARVTPGGGVAAAGDETPQVSQPHDRMGQILIGPSRPEIQQAEWDDGNRE